MAQFQFNPQQVAPAQAREARAAGWYPAKGITESDIKDTQSGGQMLSITVELQDGGFVWNNFNIVNQNQEVVQRAYADLSALCGALGIQHQVNDTRELHNRPFDVKLRVEQSKGYDDKNVIASGGFAALGAKADKYVRAAEPPRGAPFQPGSGHGAQFAPAQPQTQGFSPQQPVIAQPHPTFAPQQTTFQPPAPVQQPMPQSPQQFAPQQPFQQQPMTAGQPVAQASAIQQNPVPFQQQGFAQQAQQPQQFQQHPGAPAWTQPR